MKPVDLALHHAALGREVFPVALRRVGGSVEKRPVVRWTVEATAEVHHGLLWASPASRNDREPPRR